MQVQMSQAENSIRYRVSEVNHDEISLPREHVAYSLSAYEFENGTPAQRDADSIRWGPHAGGK